MMALVVDDERFHFSALRATRSERAHAVAATANGGGEVTRT